MPRQGQRVGAMILRRKERPRPLALVHLKPRSSSHKLNIELIRFTHPEAWQ